jgi:hypothetical protein
MTAGVIIVWMNVDERHDEELHAWYETEHVPEATGLVGVSTIRRFRDDGHALRYMVMFECADEHVETGAFAEMVKHATPWTRRIRTLFGERRLRGNYRKSLDAGQETDPAAVVVAFLAEPPRDDERQNAVGNIAGCTRRRVYQQCPPPEPFRPKAGWLEILDFQSEQEAAAALPALCYPAKAELSVRRAIGTPARAQ